MRRAIASLVLSLLASCVPAGIPGENDSVYAHTSTLCPGCHELDAFAAGGRYSVTVTLGFAPPLGCSGDGFDVQGSGAAEDVASESALSGCGRTVTFSAPHPGIATLVVLRPGETYPLDRIPLPIVAADRVSFRHDTLTSWSPLELDHIVLPVGAYLDISPTVFGNGEPIVHDPSQVTFTFEGAVSEDPNDGAALFGPRPDHVLVSATEVGSGTVQAQVGDATGTLSVDVVSPEAIDSPERWCNLEEHCDGLDNDCDGAVDETGDDGCVFYLATATCDAGRCTNIECFAGYGDCDDQPGCEVVLSNDADNCGACGNACADGEVCTDSACAPGP